MNSNIQNGKQEIALKKQIILVVDGKPMRQFYTSIFFQRLKYHVIMAKTAEDALIFIDLAMPRVVIVNIDLPDLSGLDLLKRLKQDQKTRNVPVIIYTSNKDGRIEDACVQAGCFAYLRHPASLEELFVSVEKATNKPRRFVRLDTFLDVVVGDGDPPDSTGEKDHIAVLSELGMFVSTSKELSYGSVQSFTFYLPNAPGWAIRTEGQVVHNQQKNHADKTAGIGVKFLKIGDQEREFIKEFIRKKIMEGITDAGYPAKRFPHGKTFK